MHNYIINYVQPILFNKLLKYLAKKYCINFFIIYHKITSILKLLKLAY
jgi:hypothetical protein